MSLTKCPCCANQNIEIFFKIKEAPVFSLVTVDSYDKAISIPKKRISLGFCNSCGFIFNTDFDKSVDYFTSGYEDQQGYSKTFMNFLTSLSTEFIERYKLQETCGLEIGCGKGDFINLITKISKGKGIGIDPSYEIGRQNNQSLTFIKEFYDVKHGSLNFDFIICRHTLEHIYDPKKFMLTIAESISDKENIIILFEIPQVKRILDIQAFWDIYYEHCSYFSPATLANLFRSCGFEVLDVRLVYEDQYVVIEAKLSSGSSGPIHFFPIEETLDELKNSVKLFSRKVEDELSIWREKLMALKTDNKKTIIWGGGSKAVGFLTQFADLELFDFVVDINPHMKGNFIPGVGIPYISPEDLATYKPDAVVIMNGIYKKEIKNSLIKMDLDPEILAL